MGRAVGLVVGTQAFGQQLSINWCKSFSLFLYPVCPATPAFKKDLGYFDVERT